MNPKQVLEENWSSILEFLKTNYGITDVSYRTWLLNMSLYDVEDNIVTLVVDDSKINAIAVTFIKNNYSSFITAAIEEVVGIRYDLDFVLKSQVHRLEEDRKSQDAKAAQTNLAYSSNPQYTFDSFVVCDNNNMAHAASLAVAEQPGTVFNPLFIYGGPGLGKTHLMHAIANFILEHDPSKKVLYVTSETFTNDVVKSIRSGNTAVSSQEMREKYRTNDVLLIDDIQFIIGKEATQKEFFHTFNDMRESGRQVIISSDRDPNNLQILDERLRSRIESGLSVDIQPPTYEDRLAILRSKKERNNLHDVSDDILVYIATNIKSNIRTIEGALNKVIALSRLQKKKLSLELAEEALKDMITPDTKKVITPELIISEVSEYYDITPQQLMSATRSHNIALPRQIAMYLSKEMTELSLDDVGKAFNRDHSTVHFACEKVSNAVSSPTKKEDTEIKEVVLLIRKKLNF